MGNPNCFIDEKDQIRFNEGKPIFVERGLKITKNPKTNELQGIPQEWIGQLNLPLKVDKSKAVKTKNMREEIRPDEEFPHSIMDVINKPQREKTQVLMMKMQIKSFTKMSSTKEIHLESS